jgi:hypothetical protein
VVRLSVYISQSQYLQKRSWSREMSEHPQLSTPPFTRHIVLILLSQPRSDSITSSYPCFDTECLPEANEQLLV